MSDPSQNTPEYLQSLLHAKPGSPEELADSKAKIAKYFAEQRAKEDAWQAAAPPTTRETAVTQPPPSVVQTESPGLTESPRLTNQDVLRIAICYIPVLTLTAMLWSNTWGTGMGALIVLITATPLLICFVWAYSIGRTAKLKREIRATKSILRTGVPHIGGANNPSRSRIRTAGEDGDEQCREKWQRLQRHMHEILGSRKLDQAYGPAEEALSLTAYLIGKNNKHKNRSTHIDPVNMLIERLIEEHEFEWADKLSHHYLALLTAAE